MKVACADLNDFSGWLEDVMGEEGAVSIDLLGVRQRSLVGGAVRVRGREGWWVNGIFGLVVMVMVWWCGGGVMACQWKLVGTSAAVEVSCFNVQLLILHFFLFELLGSDIVQLVN